MRPRQRPRTHTRASGASGASTIAAVRSVAIATFVAAAAILGACTSDGDESPSPSATTPAATTTTPVASPTASTTGTSEPTVEATSLATPGAAMPVDVEAAYPATVFQRAVDVAAYALGGYELIVAEQGGQLIGLGPDGADVLLDLGDRMRGAGNEEGLLSVTLDPAFASNGHVWVYYSDTRQARRTVVARFTAGADGTIDPASELTILEVEQPYRNHNGGALRFGPDGMLYLGVGDGGSGGDPHGHGQDLGTLLGSVIRLSVAGASEAEPYAIPDDNPFVGVAGAREEIWAYGLRNPWRMSFDAGTGDLWLADVGQNTQEEVNRIARGGNYGWAAMEGELCHGSPNCDPSAFEAPLAVYGRDGGRCSVTGGVVARGTNVSGIEGHYLFGDFCSGDLWALASDTDGGAEAVSIASGLGNIASINQVGAEIYLLTFGSPLLRLVDR